MTPLWLTIAIGMVTIVGTLGSFYLALRKQPHDTKNTDTNTSNTEADTFVKYQAALDKAQANYDTMYASMNERVTVLESTLHEFDIWNRALVKQLVAADIRPITKEEALKNSK